MPSTYSNLKIQLMATGENNTTWGDVTNVNLGTALEEAIVGSADVAFSNANVTLTLTDTNSTQSARNMRLNLTGTATAGYNLVVPAIEKPYIVNNGTDGTITVKNTTGTGIAVPAGKTMWLFNNGTNVVDVVTHLSSVTLGSALPVASGGTGVTTSTGTVAVVLSNNPTLVTPNLGTPSAVTLTNATGLPLSTGVTGTLPVANGGTGTATAFTAGSVVFAGASGVYSQDNANLFWDDTNNRLGIGTTSPAVPLEVSTTIRATGLFQRFDNSGLSLSGGTVFNTTGAGISLRGSSSAFNAYGMEFYAGGSERMRILTGGDVGIGTTAPDRKLDVQGSGSITVRSRSTDTSGVTVGILAAEHASGSSLQVRAGVGFTNLISTGAADPLILSTNSAERMRIDSSGNVGIGTSAPSNLLHIARSSGNAIFRVQDTSSTSDTYYISDSNGTSITQTGALPVILKTTNAERMRITSAGDVGIGTTSPGYPLTVQASSGSGAIRLVGRSADSVSTLEFINNTQATTQGFIQSSGNNLLFATSTSERMRIDSSGNVGIGTSAPGQRLEVAGSIAVTGGNMFSNSTAATWSIAGGNAYNNGGSISFGGSTSSVIAGGIYFSTGTGATNSERMRIDSSGRVGIGTSSPSYTLQVNASSGANQVAYFINDSAGSTLAGISTSINSGGNNTNSYHFAGVTQTVAIWYLYGNGTTSYTSDIRVKKNVTTTRDGYLEDVCKLRVVKYNWYNDSDDTPRELGFIAQEVEQVFPGLVQDAMHPTKDGEIHKVLKGSVMMPIMLKALQEASAKIDALTARVAQLEGN